MKTVHPEDLLVRLGAYGLALSALAVVATETQFPAPTRDAIYVLHEEFDRIHAQISKAIKDGRRLTAPPQTTKPPGPGDLRGQLRHLTKKCYRPSAKNVNTEA